MANSHGFHGFFMHFSWPELRVFSWDEPREKDIKKAMKILLKLHG